MKKLARLPGVVLSLMVLATGPGIFCMSLPVNSTRGEGDAATVLARVGDREITLRDFLERAEYTIRPAYCKGSSNVEKNIVLNTLIVEKLLAIEADKNSALMKSQGFKDFLAGRREQKMRQLLYHSVGEKKVRLDSTEIQRVFAVAGRTYRVQCLPVDLVQHDSIIVAQDSIPEFEIGWSSRTSRQIHHALFSRPLRKNQMLGPFTLGDSVDVLIKIIGWSDRVAVTQTAVTQRYQDVVEELTSVKADSIYERYALNVMKGKTLDFDADIFNKFARLLAPLYTNRKEQAEEEFLHTTYGRNSENARLSGRDYAAIQDRPLLSIDGKVWTVRDLMREIDKHPLIFRKTNRRDPFVNQLRLAIVDLVRDRYLTEEAYRKGYDQQKRVVHYEQSWRDASIALFERDRILKSLAADSTNAGRAIQESLNPYVRELLRKHSPEIAIDVDVYDGITLTRIDMFATQADVPYPIYVPAFPVLTTHNRLDYGRKMN